MKRPGWLSRAGGSGWSPFRLGRSLPLDRGLAISRWTLVGLALLAGVLALVLARRAAYPPVEVPAGAAAERLVTARLARVELPAWDPGPPLPATDSPPWESFPPPPPWWRHHPGEPALGGAAGELAAQARRDLEAGDPQAAATRLLRAAAARPGWGTHFNAGVALLAAGDGRRAHDAFLRALERLERLEPGWRGRPVHHAAEIAGRYGAGKAALAAGDCLAAIQHLRLAVRHLRSYVEAEGALVYDRKLPFAVAEAGLDNHAVWGTLAEAYAACEGRFPGDYPREYGEQDFAGEVARADAPEVREGPFPAALAACVEAETPSARCWAYSNLNQVAWASRSYFPDGAEGKDEAGRDLSAAGRDLSAAVLPSLARLAYDVAWLAAGSEEDRGQAPRFLTYAARLDRRAEVPGLDERIGELGRHLAPATRNYSLMAEPWRRRDLAGLTLEAGLAPEELKGAAWALTERWQGLLERHQPQQMFTEIDAQARRAGPWGESLLAWKRQAQEALQQALAGAIAEARTNGDLPRAAALRDYRAPWLGENWPGTARGAWLTAPVLLLWTGLALLWLLLAAALWLLHRLVVYPYLLYTTDFYRLEYRRRHAERQRAGKPFTRDEIEALEGRRG